MPNEQIEKLESRVSQIEERNHKVEADKAWETSLARKFVIFILTYLVMVVFMYFARIEFPWISAVVPALAFLLSTMSLSYFKKYWLRKK